MSNTVEKVEAVGNLFTYGLAGIVQVVKMIKFKRCKIYVANNHNHKIYVALDDCKKQKIKGWFVINPFKTSNIYETERLTDEVGIYANVLSAIDVGEMAMVTN